MIRKENYGSQCIITSFDYSMLEQVKAIDPSIKTLALFTFAYGNLSSFKDADAFSIEESTLTPQLVASIHKLGKEVYIWTPDTKQDLSRAFALHVDGIITDSIEQALTIRKNPYSGSFLSFFKQIL